MPTYDFRCDAGHSTERITSPDMDGITCAICGRVAERVRFNAPYVSRVQSAGFSGSDIGSQLEEQKNVTEDRLKAIERGRFSVR